MKDVLIRCDRAAIPARTLASYGANLREISHRGESPQLNINIRTPVVGFDRLEGRAADLILIAAYAFAADQEVSRGGETDVYGKAWPRSFKLFLPVDEPRFWSLPGTADALSAVLDFASDDQWSFVFLERRTSGAAGPLHLDIDANETLGAPDLVALVSGGLDSLGSAIEQARELGRRPIVVAHSQNFHVGTRQLALCRELRRRITGASFPIISAAVHRWKSDAPETTQRTRSFLYAALAAGIASKLGISEVHLADNGPVSVNLPINDQVLGAMATRSTHPRFMRLLNELLRAVFPDGPQVTNPLLYRTRADVLEIFRRVGFADMLHLTNSCAHQRNRSKSQPYCGICSQCIDRRFAVLAAGMEDYDPPERYEFDVFTGPLTKTKQRALALSFYETALKVRGMSDEQLWIEYPLAECIDPSGVGQGKDARQLTSMLRRQSDAILAAMERVIQGQSSDITLQRLSPDSLVAIVASQRPQGVDATVPARKAFLHSEDFRSVTVGEDQYALGEGAARAVEILYEAAEHGTPDVAWSQIQIDLQQRQIGARRMSDLFKAVRRWQRLVITKRQGMYRLNLAPSERA